MRIISRKILIEFWKKHADSEQPIKIWYRLTKQAKWNNAAQLKNDFNDASIINSRRIVFNIKGNKYRLVVDIEFKIKIAFIVYIGTHSEYTKLNIAEIKYVKTNKK